MDSLPVIREVIPYFFDTGCDPKHVEFDGISIKLAPNFARYGASSLSYDDSRNGHGTRVVSNSIGKRFGLAHDAVKRARCVKVLSLFGNGPMRAIIEGVQWAIDEDVGNATKVFHFSLGGDANKLLDDVIEEAFGLGIVTTAAAGNSHTDSCANQSPNGVNLIKVGGMDASDKMAGFSSYGACVDVGAVGVNVEGAIPDPDTPVPMDCDKMKYWRRRIVRRKLMACLKTNSNINHALFSVDSGTSFSGPIVNGWVLNAIAKLGKRPGEVRQWLRDNAFFVGPDSRTPIMNAVRNRRCECEKKARAACEVSSPYDCRCRINAHDRCESYWDGFFSF
jgi:subtilisin family serine protease